MTKINHLKYLILRSPDTRKMADWFINNLSFSPLRQDRSEDTMELMNGNCHLLLQKVNSEETTSDDRYAGIDYIALSTRDIHRALRHCEGLDLVTDGGEPFSNKSENGEDFLYFYILTPFHFRLQISESPGSRKKGVGPIICGLDHIGIATTEIEKTVTFYADLGGKLLKDSPTLKASSHCSMMLGGLPFEIREDSNRSEVERTIPSAIYGMGFHVRDAAATEINGVNGEKLLFEPQPTYDIVAIGESLIDFIPLKSKTDDSLDYSGSVGGAPANVLAAAAKYGLKTAFIGKVGADSFGSLILNVLKNSNIDTTTMQTTKEHPTTLAFVSLDESGDRSFSFYRNQTADVMIHPDEIDEGALSSCRIFHLGSVSLTCEPTRSTTHHALQMAMQNGAIISYDPNIRELLWGDLTEMKREILRVMEFADIVKVSEEELFFLSDSTDLQEGMLALRDRYDLCCLVVTLGDKGCILLYNGEFYQHPSYRVDTIDTTGAGDSFCGSLLYQLLKEEDFRRIPAEKIPGILKFCNAAGALATTKYAAIPSLPTEEEVQLLIHSQL